MTDAPPRKSASARTAGGTKRGRIERELVREGRRLAGVDEVGRGCLAGPVVAGAVILDFKRVARLDKKLRSLLRDSKQLTHPQRARMVPVIHDVALDFAVAEASVDEIEKLGIVQANFLAMRRALQALRVGFDLLLIDGKMPLSGYDGEQRAIIKGDNLCYTIAAASILAKESRDDFMRQQATVFPAYGFDAHVGYSTRQHLAMIDAHGICTLHRRNFDPIRRLTVEPTFEQGSLFDSGP
jgi:ribonuclease HII